MSSSGKCTNCGATLEMGGRKRVVCPYCGTSNIIEKAQPKPGMIVCAQCGSDNLQAHEHCSECGADLYYVCPNCSTRNTAEAVHCIKCGVNIAQAIKNWQIHEAQERARRKEQDRKRSKTLRAIFVPIGCLVGLFIAFAVFINITTQIKDKEWHIQLTATAVEEFDLSLIKWESQDEAVAIMMEPAFYNYSEGETSLHLRFYNKTSGICTSSITEMTAQDDLGNQYTFERGFDFDDPLEVEPNEIRLEFVDMSPALDENAKDLTITLPDFCGSSGGQFLINLTSPEITFEH